MSHGLIFFLGLASGLGIWALCRRINRPLSEEEEAARDEEFYENAKKKGQEAYSQMEKEGMQRVRDWCDRELNKDRSKDVTWKVPDFKQPPCPEKRKDCCPEEVKRRETLPGGSQQDDLKPMVHEYIQPLSEAERLDFDRKEREKFARAEARRFLREGKEVPHTHPVDEWSTTCPGCLSVEVDAVDSLTEEQKDRAIAILLKGIPTEVWTKIRAAIAKDPASWYVEYHFGWGTGVRNLLREKGFKDSESKSGNLDDIYVKLVEEAASKTF